MILWFSVVQHGSAPDKYELLVKCDLLRLLCLMQPGLPLLGDP